MKRCTMKYFLPFICVGLIISVCKGDRAFIPVYSDQGYAYESDNNGLRIIIKKPIKDEKKVFFSKEVHTLAQYDIVPLHIFVTNTSDSPQTFSLEDLNLPIVDLKTISSVINKKLIPSGTALSLEIAVFGWCLASAFGAFDLSTLSLSIPLGLLLIMPILFTLGVFIKKAVDGHKIKNSLGAHLCPKTMRIAPGETYCGITFVKKFDPSFL